MSEALLYGNLFEDDGTILCRPLRDTCYVGKHVRLHLTILQGGITARGCRRFGSVVWKPKYTSTEFQ